MMYVKEVGTWPTLCGEGKNSISNHWLALLESLYATGRIGFSGIEALFEYIR
jgi:hypothetical protein